MEVTLLNMTPNPVQTIERAASECYQSKPTKSGRIMMACYKSGHHSVLEHVSFTFRIEGVSRALLAQITRHRLASFSVQSQRYVDAKQFDFVIPPHIAQLGNHASEKYVSQMQTIAGWYADWQKELSEKFGEGETANEDARFVLPNACCTSMVVTMNLRELIHFCNERMCSRAQWEIRKLAVLMADAVNKATDGAFKDMLVPKCERYKDHPFCPEGMKCCGRHKTLEDIYAENVKEETTDA